MKIHAIVIQLFRKYASVVVLTLMSVFGVCLVADEWDDMQRAWEDLQIEAMAEIEVEDFEWDEDGCDNGDGQVRLRMNLSDGIVSVAISQVQPTCSTALQSDEQKRGLVRRYAPRKGIVCTNYILT
ncbi:MAG: hypothetical protein IJT12_06730 [Paludibacteraceae bacterium]|nr:hypothetical protein [Paludibacteraceae bacterium]